LAFNSPWFHLALEVDCMHVRVSNRPQALLLNVTRNRPADYATDATMADAIAEPWFAKTVARNCNVVEIVARQCVQLLTLEKVAGQGKLLGEVLKVEAAHTACVGDGSIVQRLVWTQRQ
jgi:hypothetical protein